MAAGTCGFDKLFSMRVPHILEMIFFCTDYEAYKACLEVNGTWKELLSSERYVTRGKSVFKKEIWKDEEKLFEYCNTDDTRRLLAATRLLAIKGLFASGMVDVNCRDNKRDNQTPLHDAASKGNKEVAQVLIKCGARLNVGDGKGRMPLHWAAVKGHKEVARLLIECGTDPNVADNDVVGRSPLHLAAFWGHREMAQLLIECGADPNVADNWEVTPLQLAAEKGHKEVAEILITCGADPNVPDRHGFLACLLACRRFI